MGASSLESLLQRRCSSHSPARTGPPAELKVVATTPDYAALAGAIGGDEIAIKTLAKALEDPHFVDARPSHVVTLNRADLLIESGADLEIGWLPPLVQGSRNKKVLPGESGRFLGSVGVRLLDVPSELDRSRGDVHAKGNPHFLMNPENAGIVARRLTERFCEIDKDSCPVYQNNLAAFDERLGRKIAIWNDRLAPYTGARLVTYHNTWKYFTERFGLRSETYLEPKPGIPPVTTAPGQGNRGDEIDRHARHLWSSRSSRVKPPRPSRHVRAQSSWKFASFRVGSPTRTTITSP